MWMLQELLWSCLARSRLPRSSLAPASVCSRFRRCVLPLPPSQPTPERERGADSIAPFHDSILRNRVSPGSNAPFQYSNHLLTTNAGGGWLSRVDSTCGRRYSAESQSFSLDRRTNEGSFLSSEIAKILNGLPPLRSGSKEEEEIVNSSLRPYIGLIHTGILSEVLRKVHHPNVAVAFFKWANLQPGFIPSLNVFTMMVHICGRARLFGHVEMYLEWMKRLGLKPDVVLYTELIKSFGEANRIKEAMSFFTKMKKVGVLPNIYTYNVLIHSMSANGQNQRALRLFQELEKKGILPNRVTYNTILSLYARQKRFKDAYLTYKSMKKLNCEPTMYTYNTIIDILMKAGLFEDSMQVLKDMDASKVQPDIFTFSSLLYGISNLEDGETREKILKILLQGMQALNVRPDVVWYGTLIHRYVKDNKIDSAEIVVKEMESKGVDLSPVVYNSLLVGYMSNKGYEKAEQLIDSMNESLMHGGGGRNNEKVNISLDTYVHILHFYNRSDSVDEKRVIFNLLKKLDHSIHGTIDSLLYHSESCGDNDPLNANDPVDYESVFSGFNKLISHEFIKREKLSSFVDALIEFMVTNKLYKFCLEFWKMFKPIQFFNTDTNIPLSATNWTLDLHGMSLRTAMFVLQVELISLHEKLFNHEKFPETAKIITGKSNSKRMSNSSASSRNMEIDTRSEELRIRDIVKEYLYRLNSPFSVLQHNDGCLVANGMQLKEWLLEKDIVESLHRMETSFFQS